MYQAGEAGHDHGEPKAERMPLVGQIRLAHRFGMLEENLPEQGSTPGNLDGSNVAELASNFFYIYTV